MEYEEKESEFDLDDEDRSVTQNEREVEDDLEVCFDCFVLTILQFLSLFELDCLGGRHNGPAHFCLLLLR